MKTNQAGLDLIKEFEGLKLTAYKDQVGVLTIGYGHTGNVQEGQTITQEQALQLLQVDLAKFELGVSKLVTTTITDNQFSALVSFCYNLGLGSLHGSTLLQKVNANDPSAADEFLKWDHAGGKVNDGLARRRAAERALFLASSSDSPSDTDINVSLEDIENEVLKN